VTLLEAHTANMRDALDASLEASTSAQEAEDRAEAELREFPLVLVSRSTIVQVQTALLPDRLREWGEMSAAYSAARVRNLKVEKAHKVLSARKDKERTLAQQGLTAAERVADEAQHAAQEAATESTEIIASRSQCAQQLHEEQFTLVQRCNGLLHHWKLQKGRYVKWLTLDVEQRKAEIAEKEAAYNAAQMGAHNLQLQVDFDQEDTERNTALREAEQQLVASKAELERWQAEHAEHVRRLKLDTAAMKQDTRCGYTLDDNELQARANEANEPLLPPNANDDLQIAQPTEMERKVAKLERELAQLQGSATPEPETLDCEPDIPMPTSARTYGPASQQRPA
jgi:hypothetical protein